MSVPITVNDRQFNTATTGARWTLDVTAGWDAPEFDMDMLATISPGSVYGRVMPRHRTIVCAGVVVATSAEEQWQAHHELESMVGPYEDVPFVVHEPTGARAVMVRSAPGSPKIRAHPGNALEFQLVLVAANPAKEEWDDSPSPGSPGSSSA